MCIHVRMVVSTCKLHLSHLVYFFLFLPKSYMQNNLHVTVSASVAAAVVWMSELPAKLNPVILPLMAAVKREQVRDLKQFSVISYSYFLFGVLKL